MTHQYGKRGESTQAVQLPVSRMISKRGGRRFPGSGSVI